MPVREEKAMDGGKKEVKFDTTPPMSTYLLAMVVARLGLYVSLSLFLSLSDSL